MIKLKFYHKPRKKVTPTKAQLALKKRWDREANGKTGRTNHERMDQR